MDQQPTPEWRAEQVLPPEWEDDPTVFTRAELIAAIASQVHIASCEAYTVGYFKGKRDALEQACEAVERAREWARGHDTPVKHGQVLDYIRGMDKAEEYIRAILNDNTTTKETTT